uniref:TolC family protein n=1 Tax=Paraburkholderia heleia TaxID=634127 RepID=UPI0038BAFCB5
MFQRPGEITPDRELVAIPLFEGFGRHYQVRQAEAEAEHAQDVVDETVQQVALNVWTSWQALRTATPRHAECRAQ